MKQKYEDLNKPFHSNSSQQIEWPIWPGKKNRGIQSMQEKKFKNQLKKAEKEENRFYPLFEELNEKLESETIQPFLDEGEPYESEIDPFQTNGGDRPNKPNQSE